MVAAPPTGRQHEISAAGYRAVVVEAGATLRELTSAGVGALVDGFPGTAMSSGGRGQLLIPWANRIEDGRYEFGGRVHQLPINEPGLGHAIHGLVAWSSWHLREQAGDSVELGHRLLARPGYPWTLDLTVRYQVSAAGLVVTHTARNTSPYAAPFVLGAHPYLSVGDGPVDTWELELPAATVTRNDARLLPVGTDPVAGTTFDFRQPRTIGDLQVNHGFTDLTRDRHGRAAATVRDPATDRRTTLWVDERFGWLQVHTADDGSATARRSLAVEPMTAAANAFRTGAGVVVLAPAGQPGAELTASWGIRAGT